MALISLHLWVKVEVFQVKVEIPPAWAVLAAVRGPACGPVNSLLDWWVSPEAALWLLTHPIGPTACQER